VDAEVWKSSARLEGDAFLPETPGIHGLLETTTPSTKPPWQQTEVRTDNEPFDEETLS
jgi:hypothetical protein